MFKIGEILRVFYFKEWDLCEFIKNKQGDKIREKREKIFLFIKNKGYKNAAIWGVELKNSGGCVDRWRP